MIVIIDYGMGNLKSVSNALKKINIPFKISKDIDEINNAEALILPGVGAFNDAMKNIESFKDVIIKKAKEGCPLLGICLGMQMLFEKSFEGGECEGLGLLKGEVKLIEPKEKVKIPHIGWNRLDFVNGNNTESPYVYYVHSFCAVNIDEEDLVGYSEYGGVRLTGLVKRDNIWGAQFHPEKSGEDGLGILKAFGEVII